MMRKMRFLSLAIGVVFGAGAALTTSPPIAHAQIHCENEQCIETCVGYWCEDRCTSYPDWECAGGASYCIVSVMCPLVE